jgi:hypothetical protein
MIYVVAAQQRHVELWARMKGLPRTDYWRLRTPEHIYGIPQDAEVVTTGPWWLSTEADETVTDLRRRGFTLRHENLDALMGLPKDRCRA